MPVSIEDVMGLMRALKRLAGPRFTGVGLIFYEGSVALPAVPLRAGEDAPAELPAPWSNLPTVLAHVSEAESRWHDGFHFIDCRTLALTHLAQFVAPPIAPILRPLPSRGGARHMTAALSSRVAGVQCAALLTSDGRASIYRDGECVAAEDLE